MECLLLKIYHNCRWKKEMNEISLANTLRMLSFVDTKITRSHTEAKHYNQPFDGNSTKCIKLCMIDLRSKKKKRQALYKLTSTKHHTENRTKWMKKSFHELNSGAVYLRGTNLFTL